MSAEPLEDADRSAPVEAGEAPSPRANDGPREAQETPLQTARVAEKLAEEMPREELPGDPTELIAKPDQEELEAAIREATAKQDAAAAAMNAGLEEESDELVLEDVHEEEVLDLEEESEEVLDLEDLKSLTVERSNADDKAGFDDEEPMRRTQHGLPVRMQDDAQEPRAASDDPAHFSDFDDPDFDEGVFEPADSAPADDSFDDGGGFMVPESAPDISEPAWQPQPQPEPAPPAEPASPLPQPGPQPQPSPMQTIDETGEVSAFVSQPEQKKSGNGLLIFVVVFILLLAFSAGAVVAYNMGVLSL